MAALVDRAYLKKKGEVNRPGGLKMILLGCYIEFSLESQESCVCFRNRWLQRGEHMNEILEQNHFYPKIGGHVFTPKFWKESVRT